MANVTNTFRYRAGNRDYRGRDRGHVVDIRPTSGNRKMNAAGSTYRNRSGLVSSTANYATAGQ